jgi:hypothetical protein
MFSTVVRFFKGSMLAAVLLAGLVGLAAGGALVLAGSHFVSTMSERTADDQGQSQGAGMSSAVAKCKAALPAGQHGIGKCVSAIANRHGKAASGAPKSKKDSTQDADGPTPSAKPSPKPSAKP